MVVDLPEDSGGLRPVRLLAGSAPAKYHLNSTCILSGSPLSREAATGTDPLDRC